MGWVADWRAEFHEEYPEGMRQVWREWRAERKRWRSMSKEERALEILDRHTNAAYMMVSETPPDPQIAGALMFAQHGENLVRVETNNVVIVAILKNGKALEYDALGRLLTRE